jgi:hypothetical protein
VQSARPVVVAVSRDAQHRFGKEVVASPHHPWEPV